MQVKAVLTTGEHKRTNKCLLHWICNISPADRLSLHFFHNRRHLSYGQYAIIFSIVNTDAYISIMLAVSSFKNLTTRQTQNCNCIRFPSQQLQSDHLVARYFLHVVFIKLRHSITLTFMNCSLGLLKHVTSEVTDFRLFLSLRVLCGFKLCRFH